jgi:hypothetical protein
VGSGAVWQRAQRLLRVLRAEPILQQPRVRRDVRGVRSAAFSVRSPAVVAELETAGCTSDSS